MKHIQNVEKLGVYRIKGIYANAYLLVMRTPSKTAITVEVQTSLNYEYQRIAIKANDDTSHTVFSQCISGITPWAYTEKQR